ncbi:hypothetical protein FOA52_006188 [Chlamydomonas sp. UWO 241]|nr:hypothetical protein FOA52_006188 [Chlamydomonas sp. UWO 241]
MLLDSLSPDELKILDDYESKEYYREEVTALLEDGSTVDACVYAWKDEYMHMVLNKPWDYDEWRRLYLGKWVSRLSPDAPHPDGMLDD